MQCERCAGYLMRDRQDHVGIDSQLPIWQCVNCGNRIDGGILKNRVGQGGDTRAFLKEREQAVAGMAISR